MSTETRATADHAEGTPTHQECRELVARLVASKHFRRSERHCAFISYVCNVALTEAGREIRETEVGWKVFGRPAGYDTAQDNIVRVNASEVRHRLKEYFQGEGMQEPLGLEIPRGSYRPVFARRSMLVEIQEPPPLEAPPRVAPVLYKRMLLSKWVLALLCFGLGGVVSWIVAQQTRQPPGEKMTTTIQFWSRLFKADKTTDVLMGDSCLSLYEDLTKESVSLSQYLNHEYLSRIPSRSSVNKEQLATLMSRRYTGMADVQLLRRLTVLAAPADQRRLIVYYARDYPPGGLLKSNAIIIGSKRSNPWAEPFERLMNFRFEFLEDTSITSIHNERPQAGEQKTYDQPRSKPDAIESYAVVALLPNLGGTGNALLLAGANMDGTQAAGEFVTSERLLLQLKKRLGLSTSDTFPYFEALLHGRRLGADAIEDIEIQAVRTH
jgi:hypothetical protein